jgi:predicted kinase
MYSIKEFDAFFEKFKTTQHWQQMLNTVEDSPWHREANVAVHTEMVMQQFRDRFMHLHTEAEAIIGLTALLFHDTGKPSAEEVLEKKDGSGDKYRRYAGHEQDSAVTFQECYMSMPELQAMLPTYAARAVRWIIEHHLPYGLKDKQKRQGLAAATFAALADAGASYSLFFDCLRSDAAGRISDDHEQKLQAVEDWIAEFQTVDTTPTALTEGPTMFILVGPSGSGKSTWTRARFDQGIDEVISYDTYKQSFWMSRNMPFSSSMAPPSMTAVEFYDLAWAYANEHESEFNKFANELINNAIDRVKAKNGTVFVDVVNASKKKRAKFVELAKQKKFRVVAVEFWVPFKTLMARQKTRGDKAVPYTSVKQQLNAVGGVWAGVEAAEVWMVV